MEEEALTGGGVHKLNSDEGVRGSSHGQEDRILLPDIQRFISASYATTGQPSASLTCTKWSEFDPGGIQCPMATMNVRKSVGGKPFQLLHVQQSRAERPQREVWFSSKKLEPL